MELKGWTATQYKTLAAKESGVYGCYCIDDTGCGWMLVYRDALRTYAIDARDKLGPEDWPSAEMAQLAAQQHYERMRETGETPDVAASRIPTDPEWYEAKMGTTP